MVVFDLGGVICRFLPERRLRALSSATGLRAEEVDEAIWGSGLDDRAEAGELTLTDTTEAILDALHRRLDLATLRAAWSRGFVLDEKVCRLVRAVRSERCVFTNNGPLLTACLSEELSPVQLVARRVICSWEVRARKPDPVAFHRLAEQLQQSPTDMTLIDDSAANCRAAESIGMHVIQFRSAEELAPHLERLQLLDAPWAR